MSSFYAKYPVSGGSGGVTTYANLAAFPSAVTAGNGALGIALDTNILYESNGTTWIAIGGPGTTLSIGSPANGLVLTNNALSLTAATGSVPGALTAADWNTFNNKQAALGFTPENSANKGAANGYAPLDSGSKVPVANLPSTLMNYQGAWSAATNSPTLADGTGTNGDVYRASTAGTQNLGSGAQFWAIGDFAIYNGSIWQHSPAADGVSSVNGATGAVTVNAINQLTSDVTAGPASGSASAAATVVQVGGSTASNIHTAELLVNTAQSGNKFLASPSNGSSAAPAFRAIVAADIPTLNQNTTGTAANVTGIVAIANGGTGQITQQLAINALAGTQSSGTYLRSDGTNTTLSSIQAADVPTLNQNTTGTAATITGVATIAHGGTNNASLAVTAGGVLYTDGTKVVNVGAGTGGQALISGGSGAPTWGTNGGFAFFKSSVVNTSANTSSASFVTLGNSPALSVVCTATGTYKVYVSIPYLSTSNGGNTGAFQLTNTSGGATTLATSQAFFDTESTGVGATAYVQSVYTLTTGNTYVFDFQGQIGGGGNIQVRGDLANFYMFCERVG